MKLPIPLEETFQCQEVAWHEPQLWDQRPETGRLHVLLQEAMLPQGEQRVYGTTYPTELWKLMITFVYMLPLLDNENGPRFHLSSRPMPRKLTSQTGQIVAPSKHTLKDKQAISKIRTLSGVDYCCQSIKLPSLIYMASALLSQAELSVSSAHHCSQVGWDRACVASSSYSLLQYLSTSSFEHCSLPSDPE
jgi:hypothetical protein